jgi:hypothetical protein
VTVVNLLLVLQVQGRDLVVYLDVLSSVLERKSSGCFGVGTGAASKLGSCVSLEQGLGLRPSSFS